MRSTRLLSLALAASLALGLAGCGGDDDAGPSKADFVKQANAICKKGDAEIAKLEAPTSAGAAQDAYIEKAAEISLDEIADIRDLGFPKADADDLDSALGSFEKAFETVKDDPSKVATISSDASLGKATETVTAYGLKECGGSS